jgi:multiple sugar transport system substrate-binding protein
MNRVRFLCILSVVAILTLAIAGCSPTTPTAAPVPTAAPTEAQTEAPTEAPTEPPAEPVVVKMITMQQAGYTPEEFDEIIARFEAQNPGVTVEISFVTYDELHDKLITSISGDDPAYDIVKMDNIWTVQFAEAGWLLDVTDRITPEMQDGVFPTAWNMLMYNGQYYGVPWLIDQKYFFYNTDLLAAAGFDAPPTTWEEMGDMAVAMKDQELVEYPFISSWAQAEAAVCDFVVLLYGNGGQFFDENNQPVFNDERGVEVLTWMVNSVNDGVTNPSAISSFEEDVRNVFSQGNAAFALNWLYMYDIAQYDETQSQITGKVGMALMPSFERAKAEGIESSSVDGSEYFAITAGSHYPDESWAFLEFLTSQAIQEEFSAHLLPMWSASFEEPGVQTLLAATRSNPVTVPMFAQQFQYVHTRPFLAQYTEASTALQLALQEALTGAKTPQEALDDAVATIQGL